MNAETIGNIEHMITGWELFAEKVKGLKGDLSARDKTCADIVLSGCELIRSEIKIDDYLSVIKHTNEVAHYYLILKELVGDGNRSSAAGAEPAGAGFGCAGDCE